MEFVVPSRLARKRRAAPSPPRRKCAICAHPRRNNALGSSLGFFLEKSDRLIPTFTNVLHAVEKSAKIGEDGETIHRLKSPPMPWEVRG